MQGFSNTEVPGPLGPGYQHYGVAFTGAGANEVPTVTLKRCNCKKAKCLKLYCVCFGQGVFCDGCACRDCCNTVNNEKEVYFERQRILQRSPRAFAPKVEQHTTGNTHKKGCRCRKSKCLKRYCECLDAGVHCSSFCRCEECHNRQDLGSLQLHSSHSLQGLGLGLTGMASLPDMDQALQSVGAPGPYLPGSVTGQVGSSMAGLSLQRLLRSGSGGMEEELNPAAHLHTPAQTLKEMLAGPTLSAAGPKPSGPHLPAGQSSSSTFRSGGASGHMGTQGMGRTNSFPRAAAPGGSLTGLEGAGSGVLAAGSDQFLQHQPSEARAGGPGAWVTGAEAAGAGAEGGPGGGPGGGLGWVVAGSSWQERGQGASREATPDPLTLTPDLAMLSGGSLGGYPNASLLALASLTLPPGSLPLCSLPNSLLPSPRQQSGPWRSQPPQQAVRPQDPSLATPMAVTAVATPYQRHPALHQGQQEEQQQQQQEQQEQQQQQEQQGGARAWGGGDNAAELAASHCQGQEQKAQREQEAVAAIESWQVQSGAGIQQQGSGGEAGVPAPGGGAPGQVAAPRALAGAEGSLVVGQQQQAPGWAAAAGARGLPPGLAAGPGGSGQSSQQQGGGLDGVVGAGQAEQGQGPGEGGGGGAAEAVPAAAAMAAGASVEDRLASPDLLAQPDPLRDLLARMLQPSQLLADPELAQQLALTLGLDSDHQHAALRAAQVLQSFLLLARGHPIFAQVMDAQQPHPTLPIQHHPGHLTLTHPYPHPPTHPQQQQQEQQHSLRFHHLPPPLSLHTQLGRGPGRPPGCWSPLAPSAATTAACAAALHGRIPHSPPQSTGHNLPPRATHMEKDKENSWPHGPAWPHGGLPKQGDPQAMLGRSPTTQSQPQPPLQAPLQAQASASVIALPGHTGTTFSPPQPQVQGQVPHLQLRPTSLSASLTGAVPDKLASAMGSAAGEGGGGGAHGGRLGWAAPHLLAQCLRAAGLHPMLSQGLAGNEPGAGALKLGSGSFYFGPPAEDAEQDAPQSLTDPSPSPDLGGPSLPHSLPPPQGVGQVPQQSDSQADQGHEAGSAAYSPPQCLGTLNNGGITVLDYSRSDCLQHASRPRSSREGSLPPAPAASVLSGQAAWGDAQPGQGLGAPPPHPCSNPSGPSTSHLSHQRPGPPAQLPALLAPFHSLPAAVWADGAGASSQAAAGLGHEGGQGRVKRLSGGAECSGPAAGTAAARLASGSTWVGGAGGAALWGEGGVARRLGSGRSWSGPVVVGGPPSKRQRLREEEVESSGLSCQAEASSQAEGDRTGSRGCSQLGEQGRSRSNQQLPAVEAGSQMHLGNLHSANEMEALQALYEMGSRPGAQAHPGHGPSSAAQGRASDASNG